MVRPPTSSSSGIKMSEAVSGHSFFPLSTFLPSPSLLLSPRPPHTHNHSDRCADDTSLLPLSGASPATKSSRGETPSNSSWLVKVSAPSKARLSSTVVLIFCNNTMRAIFFHNFSQRVARFFGPSCAASTARKTSSSGWRAKTSRRSAVRSS